VLWCRLLPELPPVLGAVAPLVAGRFRGGLGLERVQCRTLRGRSRVALLLFGGGARVDLRAICGSKQLLI